MIEVESNPERVMLVGVQTQKYSDEHFASLMKELSSLTETAGGVPVKIMTQKLTRLDSRTAVGSGKLEEIKAQVEIEEIDLVIFFNGLTPSMNRHVEEGLGVRAIDRIQLILDIFALRANSREGKLQVELAQYEFLLPRMHGQGKLMSRLGGGIGTRGPGETKLETDRRHIRNLINITKKELEELDDHRERTRIRRQSGREFNLGLVGYTNSGKSTLLSKLTETETYIQDQLFATLDPLTRKLTINGQSAFTLTDTVGFIEELPTQLIKAFKSTLEEMRYVDLLVHVVDASSPERDRHEQTVLSILADLNMEQIPVLTIYNKADKIEIDSFEPTLFPNIVVSAYNEEDIERLKQKIWEHSLENSEKFTVEIQPAESELLALYRQKTLIESIDFNEEHQFYILTGYRRRIKDDNNDAGGN